MKSYIQKNPRKSDSANNSSSGTVKKIVLKVLVWWLGCALLSAVVSSLPGAIGTFLYTLSVAFMWFSLWKFIVKPIVRPGEKKSKAEANAPDAVVQFYLQNAAEAAMAAKSKERSDRNAAEADAIRALLKDDITTCCDGPGWYWASPTTTTRIIICEDDGEYGGTISTDSNGRVTSVTVRLPDGNARVYPNRPYLQKLENELKAFDTPILEFFATRKGGDKATFEWLNRAEAIIILTFPEAKLVNVQASVEWKCDKVAALRYVGSDGKEHRLLPGKKQPAKAASEEEKTDAPKPEKAKKETKAPKTKAEDKPAEKPADAPKSEPKPADPPVAAPTEEVVEVPASDVPHAEPIDPEADPGISEEAMVNNATLAADSLFQSLESAAATAYDNGESVLVIDWPENLLTKREVEIFGDYLMEHSGFAGFDIDSDNRRVILHMPTELTDSDEGFEGIEADY